MTPVQIAYFKHFMFDKGIQRIYISMYRRRRIKGGPGGDSQGNPESLEQFLQEIPYQDVILKAFMFYHNSEYGFDYWKDISDKWQKYWELHENNFSNDKYVTLKGTFAILRQNWDDREYFRKESIEDTYKRMKIEPPLRDENIEEALYVPSSYTIEQIDKKKLKFKVGDTIKGTISGEVLNVVAIHSDSYETGDGGYIDFDKEDFWTLVEDDTEAAQEVEEKNGDAGFLDGFSLVESTNRHGGRKMGTKIVSVNLKNNGYRVTFSSKESEKLREHKYEFVQMLTKEQTSEVALKFNHNKGCSVNIKGSRTSEAKNVVINAKDIADGIRRFYKLPKTIEYFSLRIVSTTLVNSDMYYILKYEG